MKCVALQKTDEIQSRRQNKKENYIINNIMFIDTHAHLYLCNKKLSELLKNAGQNNIEYIINVGIDIKTSLLSYEQSKISHKIIPTAGIHPSSYKNDSQFDEIKELINKYKFKAIGETGLDYHHHYTSVENQKKLFIFHLGLAREHNLPVIIHNRKADQDILEIIKDYQDLKMVFHCYSTDVDFAREVDREGVYFSFTGSITYSKKGKVIRTVQYLPLEKIMLETDCPYLTPQKYQGQENQPAYLIEIAQKIAEIKNCSLTKVAKTTTENAKKLFAF
ncbi:TatD family hydrolase [Candidatus Margulisiibacteriota bacterium]